MLDSLGQDVRYAVRTLRTNLVFSGVAVLTLALGVGATTAMFSVANGVLLRPLPVRDQNALIVVWKEQRRERTQHIPFRIDDLHELERDSGRFDGIAAYLYDAPWGVVADVEGEPVRMKSTLVSGSFFRTLGVPALLGRTFTAADDVRGAPPTVVVGEDVWRRSLHGDPAVVGRTVRIGERRFTVVGVVPARFSFPAGTEIWAPVLAATPEGNNIPEPAIDFVVRLRPGVTAAHVRAEIDAYLRRGELAGAELLRDQRAVTRPLADVIVGNVRPAIAILLGAVALVLVIACINVANLQLTRGLRRQRELAVRAAIGAGRGRIVRQLLTESAVLAVMGGLVALPVAELAIRGLLAIAPSELPRTSEIRLDGAVLSFAIGASLATALLFGLAPAIWAARSDLIVALRAGGRGEGESRVARTAKRALVVAQFALAVLVLTGAGLLVRSLARLQTMDLGFEAEQLILVDLEIPRSKYPEPMQQRELIERIAPRLAAIPGVSAVSPLMLHPFLGLGGWDANVSTEGQGALEAAANPWLNLEPVVPPYFETLGLEIRRGRAITDADREGAPGVAVLNETAAAKLWPGGDALGKRIKFGPPNHPERWLTVVGIAEDARYRELTSARPSLYVPLRQQRFPFGPRSLALRTGQDTARVIAQVRPLLRAIDPDVRVLSLATIERLLEAPLARPRFNAALLGSYALLALLLAAVGIYGVIASFVRQRTHEIGVRMALGARSGEIGWLVLGEGMRLACIGTALGVGAALASTRILSAVLFEIRATDPLTYAGAAAVLLLVAAVACYIPSRQAARVEPVIALRGE